MGVAFVVLLAVEKAVLGAAVSIAATLLPGILTVFKVFRGSLSFKRKKFKAFLVRNPYST